MNIPTDKEENRRKKYPTHLAYKKKEIPSTHLVYNNSNFVEMVLLF